VEQTLPPLPEMLPADALVSAIVWTDDGTKQESVWLEGETEVARRDGVVIAAKDGLWKWTVTPKTIRLQAKCDKDATGQDAQATLVRLDKKETLVAAGPGFAREFVGNQAFDQTITLDASAGPFVFLRVSSSFAACGERGVPSFSFRTFDITTGKDATLLNGADVPAEAKALAVNDCPCDAFLRVDPHYFDESPFRAFATFTNGSPYNFLLTSVPLATVPPKLYPFSTIPVGVVRWHAAHAKTSVGGVSVVTQRKLRDTFLAH
jgi:hypothetical protein